MRNTYIGHENQLYGVEEYRLSGGKGDGMRFLQVRNGKGLELQISLDRCADISRVTFKGDNFGYFAPCGYVHPSYYDGIGAGFLKSFTAGFMTTCGLWAVGSPCNDEGEELPLHGTISNTPCEKYMYCEKDGKLYIEAAVRDAYLFARKLLLERQYCVDLSDNTVTMTDKITNIGSEGTPLEVLYHCNMGYPLLSENSVIEIPSEKTTPRNNHAASDLDNCLKAQKPTAGYEEMCYYHKLSGVAEVSIKNPDIGKKLTMSFDTKQLPFFTQWKMMGEYDYVMGLEPGNCHPDGRDVMRKQGLLEFLAPNETKTHIIKFTFTEEK